MSTLTVPIRIKRGVGTPSTLKQGELAFDENGQRLFIGSGVGTGGNAATVVELTTPPALLEQLSNVAITSGPNDGDVLTYDASEGEWIAQAVAAASIAWADVTGKPTVFTPDTHSHAWGDITSGVPATFAPSAHKASHATGGADALSPADIGAAATSHSHAWADITSGVPSTFTPSAHSHTVTLEISGFIESPEAKTYVLSPSVPTAITITNLKAQTSAGTVDAKLQDDGVDITDATLPDVGTSLASPINEPNAVVAAGSKLALVVSDLQSSPADLAFTVYYTVTSANNA